VTPVIGARMTGASMVTGPTWMGFTRLMGGRAFTGRAGCGQGAAPMTMQTVTALIVAAGSGSRLGGGIPKQYRKLGGKSVLAHAVDALTSHPAIDEVRVVIGHDQLELANGVLDGRNVGEPILGGATRADSVQAGLAAIDGDVVLVHDAARPFCPHDVVDRLLNALGTAGGAVPVLPIADTLAVADAVLGDPIDRSQAVRVQTPQAFRLRELRDAYRQWTGDSPTDEATVARAAGLDVAAVEGDARLDKLTAAADWARAEAVHAARLVVRTAMGFDVHAFGGEGPIMIGGVAIPHERGLAGHSDADVVLHAITDALLGAAGLGDIGTHFSDKDPRWAGADSMVFLSHVCELLAKRGYGIANIDATILAERPKMLPHIPAMKSRLAEVLGIDPTQLNIKAKTNEGLDAVGRGEAIAAQAVALIFKRESNE